MFPPLTLAIIQQKPAVLDLQRGITEAAIAIQTAVQAGAQLIIFGETWLSGYPVWMDYCPEVGLWDHPPAREVFSRLHANSLLVPGPETQQLALLAREYQVLIGIGVNERIETGPGNGTIYNSFLLFGADGQLLIHHRKLIPTYTERLLYGQGDAAGLTSVDTSFGRIGGLICWEHWMPLSRQALHDAGEHIHIALWPNVHEMHQIASRHYAFEGRCFVIAAGQMMQASDFPAELTLPETLAANPDTWVLRGGSCVIGPDGAYIMEPVFDREGIFYATISPGEVQGHRMTLDTSGHYSRRDVFDFGVNRGGR